MPLTDAEVRAYFGRRVLIAFGAPDLTTNEIGVLAPSGDIGYELQREGGQTALPIAPGSVQKIVPRGEP